MNRPADCQAGPCTEFRFNLSYSVAGSVSLSSSEACLRMSMPSRAGRHVCAWQVSVSIGFTAPISFRQDLLCDNVCHGFSVPLTHRVFSQYGTTHHALYLKHSQFTVVENPDLESTLTIHERVARQGLLICRQRRFLFRSDLQRKTIKPRSSVCYPALILGLDLRFDTRAVGCRGSANQSERSKQSRHCWHIHLCFQDIPTTQ